MKNLLINEGDREENRKTISVDIVKKNIPTWTKDRERKTESGGEKKDLVEERFDRNKVLFSSW